MPLNNCFYNKVVVTALILKGKHNSFQFKGQFLVIILMLTEVCENFKLKMYIDVSLLFIRNQGYYFPALWYLFQYGVVQMN